jgi:hypothetical protein
MKKDLHYWNASCYFDPCNSVLVIVPTILNVIETSRKSTAESSVLG